MHIEYKPERAYLDLARAHINSRFIYAESDVDAQAIKPDVVFALASMGYIYSYSAIAAFVSSQLAQHWDTHLQQQFPQAGTFAILLNGDLRELKDMIKVLCKVRGYKPMCEVDHALWMDLLQVIRPVRNFLIHPRPGSDFDDFMRKALEERTWDFPSRVASRVLAYFYLQAGISVPPWIGQGTTLHFPEIAVS